MLSFCYNIVAFMKSHLVRTRIPTVHRQWLSKKGMIDLWNLHEYATGIAGLKLLARTNCALERYNREFNEKFSRRHPGLTTFVSCLSDAADEVVEKLNNIIAGKFFPPEYDDIPFPSIPDDYAEFEAPYVNISLTGEMKSHAQEEEVEDEEEVEEEEVVEIAAVAEEAMGRGKRVRKKTPTYDV